MTSNTSTKRVLSGSVPGKPSQVPTVSSYDVSGDTVIMSYTAPTNNGGYRISSYVVYVDNVALDPATSTSPGVYFCDSKFDLTNLTPGTEYKVQFAAVNAVGKGTKSDAFYLTFMDVPTPPTVTLMTTDTTLLVTWTTSSIDDFGYMIYINDGLGSHPVLAYNTTGTPSRRSYNTTTDGYMNLLECGNTYIVEVTSVNARGESEVAQSSIVVGTLPTPPDNLMISESMPADVNGDLQPKLLIVWNNTCGKDCLPVSKYVISLNDGTTTTYEDVDADQEQLYYTFSTNSPSTTADYGIELTIAIKAVNKKDANGGEYSEDITVITGSRPDVASDFKLVSRTSKTSLEVSWIQDVLITGNIATSAYRIYRLNSDGTEDMMFTTEGTTLTTEAVIQGLTTGRKYTLVVRAYNMWGESSDSNELEVTAGVNPSQPPIPTLYSSTSSSLTLKISPSSDNGGTRITDYIIQFSYSGQVVTANDDLISCGVSSSQCTVPGLPTSTSVGIKVKAVNSISLESDYSTLVTYVVATIPAAPSAPTKFGDAVEQADGSIAATVQWTQLDDSNSAEDGGSDITGYLLYYKEADKGTGFKIAYNGKGRPEIVQHTVFGLKKSQKYLFKVSAINKIGEGPTSATYSLLAAVAPSKPLNLMITSTSAGTINLAWDAPKSNGGSELTKYGVSYKDTTTNTYGTYTVTAPTTTAELSTANSVTLTETSLYMIRVYAINEVGGVEKQSSYSDSVYGYPSVVPHTLANPTITEKGETSVKIKWTKPTSVLPITGYQVYSNNGDDAYPSVLRYNGKSVPTRLETTITNLTTGSEYLFMFVAYNGAGMSQASDLTSARTGRLPEPPMSITQVESTVNGELKFTWEASSQTYGMEIVQYKVYLDEVEQTPCAKGQDETLECTIPCTTISSSDETIYDCGSTTLDTTEPYAISVSTESSAGEGVKSATKVMYGILLPSEQITLTVTEETRDSCSISWTIPNTATDIVGYVILVDDTIAYNGEFNSAKLTAVLSGLASGITYDIKGYAVNRAGAGPESDVKT